MNRLHIYSLVASLGLIGLAFGQEQQQPPDPRPSTSETEGTAADRTPPDQTATRPARPGEAQVDPRPSTSEAEGTAADTTPPGKTSTMPGSASKPTSQRSELVGASVVTPGGAPIGEVVDVVFDSAAQPAFVVISSEGEAAAVPYSVASSMKSGDKVVIDQSRLQSAPKVKDGEWRSESNSAWKRDSSRYWERG